MNIPDAILPLLQSFDAESSAGMWWMVANEYAEAESTASLNALANELQRFVENCPDENVLSNSLISIGCYYWPGKTVFYRTWLLEMADYFRKYPAVKDKK